MRIKHNMQYAYSYLSIDQTSPEKDASFSPLKNVIDNNLANPLMDLTKTRYDCFQSSKSIQSVGFQFLDCFAGIWTCTSTWMEQFCLHLNIGHYTITHYSHPIQKRFSMYLYLAMLVCMITNLTCGRQLGRTYCGTILRAITDRCRKCGHDILPAVNCWILHSSW